MISNPKSTTLRFLLAMGLILILLAASGCALLEQGNGGKTKGLMPPKKTDKTNAPPDPMRLPE